MSSFFVGIIFQTNDYNPPVCEHACMMRALIFSSHMRAMMRGTHISKFDAPTPLGNSRRIFALSAKLLSKSKNFYLYHS